MHGAHKFLSIVTAKMEFDEEINFHRDKGHKAAILNTDLSLVYKTVLSHALLLSKLEHMGIRDKELEFFTSFLENGSFYTKVLEVLQQDSSDVRSQCYPGL